MYTSINIYVYTNICIHIYQYSLKSPKQALHSFSRALFSRKSPVFSTKSMHSLKRATHSRKRGIHVCRQWRDTIAINKRNRISLFQRSDLFYNKSPAFSQKRHTRAQVTEGHDRNEQKQHNSVSYCVKEPYIFTK